MPPWSASWLHVRPDFGNPVLCSPPSPPFLVAPPAPPPQVFMDSVNRRFALQFLLEFAVRHPDRQILLLTPQDISGGWAGAGVAAGRLSSARGVLSARVHCTGVMLVWLVTVGAAALGMPCLSPLVL